MKFSLKNVNTFSVLTNHSVSVITISGVIEQKMCFRGSSCRSLWKGNSAKKVQYADFPYNYCLAGILVTSVINQMI